MSKMVVVVIFNGFFAIYAKLDRHLQRANLIILSDMYISYILTVQL